MGGGNLRIFPKPLHLPVTFPWLCNLPHRHKDNCPIQAVIHATPLWNMAAGSTDNTAPALIPTNPGRRWWSPACAWPSLAHLLTPHAPDKITHFDVFQMKIFSQSLQTQQDWMGKEGRQPTSQARNTILCAPHRVLWGHEPPQLQPSCLVSWGSEAAAAAYTYVGFPGKMCTNLCYFTWVEELTHWPCGQAWWWGMLFGANQLKPRAPGTRITKMQKTVNRLYISSLFSFSNQLCEASPQAWVLSLGDAIPSFTGFVPQYCTSSLSPLRQLQAAELLAEASNACCFSFSLRVSFQMTQICTY